MKADFRLVLPATTGWLFAGVLVGFPDAVFFCFLAAAVSATVSLVVLCCLHSGALRSFLAVLSVCLASAALVCASLNFQVAQRNLADSQQIISHSVRATVTVTSLSTGDSSPKNGGSSAHFSATMTRIVSGDHQQDIQVPVLVFEDSNQPSQAQEIGAELLVIGRLKPTELGENIDYLLFSQSPISLVSAPPWFLSWANGLRNSLRQSAQELPQPGAELISGLALGDVSALSEKLNSQMIDSGLSHLTAVSGANCAIIVAAIMLLGGFLRLRRWMRVVLCLVVLLLFVILVTPSPSVLRAAVMAGIVLFSLASGRAVFGVSALALATIGLLAVDPWLSRSYGFALSVLATAGLLVLAKPLAAIISRWFPEKLALFIAIPLAAQLACQPVLLLLSPHLSPYAVIANIMAEPAAPLASVLGLCACLIGFLFPPCAVPAAWLAWFPAAWIAAVARFFAELPGASLPWLAGIVGVFAIVLLTVAALIVVFARIKLRRYRIASLAVILLFVSGYCGTLVGASVSERSVLPENWQIAACDIGQGDAVVVREREHYAIVDVGPDPILLQHCLDRLGITSLDLLVLTHYDKDHVGGLDAVLGKVSTVLLGPTDGVKDQRIVNSLQESGARVLFAHQGDSGFLGEMAWNILWPQEKTALRGNPASVTIEFFGQIRSIFLGDLGEEAQQMLLATHRVDDVDVVKVAHHGSADQSEDFYHILSAEIGIISVGANRYGHPTANLLHILEQNHTRALRTDQSGLIVLAPSEHGIMVWSEGQARVEAKK